MRNLATETRKPGLPAAIYIDEDSGLVFVRDTTFASVLLALGYQAEEGFLDSSKVYWYGVGVPQNDAITLYHRYMQKPRAGEFDVNRFRLAKMYHDDLKHMAIDAVKGTQDRPRPIDDYDAAPWVDVT